MYIDVKIRLFKQVLDTPPGTYRRDVIEVQLPYRTMEA